MKRAWNDENALKLMCKDCFSGKNKVPSPYIQKLLFFRSLKLSVGQIDINFLTPDEWLDINRIDEEISKIMATKK